MHIHSLTAQFATAGIDYTAISDGRFILKEDMTTVQIEVKIRHNSKYEQDEKFQGLLSLVSGERVSVDINSADTIIIDDKRKHIHSDMHTYTHILIHPLLTHMHACLYIIVHTQIYNKLIIDNHNII